MYDDGTDKRAVVLLSGGLDSAVALYDAMARGWDCWALTVAYGQRHVEECDAARAIAGRAGIRCGSVRLGEASGFRWLISSPLLRHGDDVPKGRTPEQMAADRGVAPTYVPGRNTVLLALALSWAESLGASEIIIGANRDDAAGYPDCRPAYVRAWNEMAAYATARLGAVALRAPFLNLTKRDVVQMGRKLGVPFELTVSCYDPTPEGACAECDACILRLSAFDLCGFPDPAAYRGERDIAAWMVR